ncbi:MAG: PfkB family carbohydrate kinase [Chloroflexi bacterium]|nr:PfkB family carbohydrate kinase [Chloroflexota bacterium]
MHTRWDVLGMGVIAVDDLLYVERFPQPDTKNLILTQCRQGGGPTATGLVAAARLGVRAAYCAILGDDELSRFSITELEREGVDCAPIVRRAGARPHQSVVIVERTTGVRTILYSGEGVVNPTTAEITGELVARCRVLLMDGYVAGTALCAVELAQARGIPVVADVEIGADPAAAELVRRADHLIVGLALGQQASGEREPEAVVAALGSANRACCAVTVGDRGCWYAERGGPVHHVPALVVPVVDTTGCGDVFHGAYAAAIARGESVERAIAVATVAAGLKATQPGGRAGIPNWETVERFLADRGN